LRFPQQRPHRIDSSGYLLLLFNLIANVFLSDPSGTAIRDTTHKNAHITENNTRAQKTAIQKESKTIPVTGRRPLRL
jgi:hypothetical protein